jgi:shikimate kinase
MQVFKRAGGRIYFLEIGPETASTRIQGDPTTRARRPALTDKDPETEIREQITLRAPYYLKAADVVVKAEARTVEQVAEEILRDLQGPGNDQPEHATIA